MTRNAHRPVLGRLVGFLAALVIYVIVGLTNAFPEWVFSGYWFLAGMVAAVSGGVLLGFLLDRASEVGEPPVEK